MQPYHVRLVQNYAKNALIEISFEGMGSTEVKKYLENKGFIAEKIARVGIGHLSVEKMAPGTFKRIEASSVQALLTQPELAKRQIAALTESKKSEVKVVSEGTLKKDAEKKRMGRKGIFVEGGADARKTSRRPAVQVRFRKPTPS
jgi:predicted XRE-type DNA-binding protein